MKRQRPIINVTLSPEAITRLDEIATRRGESRSAAVERLVREAVMPRAKGEIS
jgi:metal-responsive CopG/Arc/MetJ family transcriptional regulator